jgi:hypothetical protein
MRGVYSVQRLESVAERDEELRPSTKRQVSGTSPVPTYAGHWQLDLELERDLSGGNSFDVTVDAANATAVSLDSSQARGAVYVVPVFTAPIPLSRGVHIVRIAYGPDTFTCGDAAWSDDCDGNGIVRGLRLRRVGP